MIEKNKLLRKRMNILLAIILVIALFAVYLSLAGALTSQDEISQLESEISSEGYGWLVNYNLKDGGKI